MVNLVVFFVMIFAENDSMLPPFGCLGVVNFHENVKNRHLRCGNGESVPIMTSIPTKPLILVLWVKVVRIIVRILRRGRTVPLYAFQPSMRNAGQKVDS